MQSVANLHPSLFSTPTVDRTRGASDDDVLAFVTRWSRSPYTGAVTDFTVYYTDTPTVSRGVPVSILPGRRVMVGTRIVPVASVAYVTLRHP